MSRLVAWLAFGLGIGASTAANIAHAQNGLGPRLAAAFAPLALVLAVELAVRLRWRAGARWWCARWIGTGSIGLVTAIVSYRHQSELLAGYGEDYVNAAILPLSIDGLMLVSAAALLSLGLDRNGQSTDSPWTEDPWTVPPAWTETDGQSEETETVSVRRVRSDSPSSPSVQRTERLSVLADSFPDTIPTSAQIKTALGLKSQSVAHGLRTALIEARATARED